MSFYSKIALFLWTLFAPQQAKAEVESIVKEFVKLMAWIVTLTFLLGVAFIAGTYYLGKELNSHLDIAVVSYLLSALFCFFAALVTGIVLFRFLIQRAIKRVLEKGSHIISAFTTKKV